MTMRKTEWDVLHPLDGSHVAVIRLVTLGPKREPFYRVVSPEPDRSRRTLLGYWATLELAHDAALALLELRTGKAIEGGSRRPSRQVPPQPAGAGAARGRRRSRSRARSSPVRGRSWAA